MPCPLDDVSAIVAYKLDELRTDLVCCDFVTGASDSEQIRTIHEELPGIDAAMAGFKILPGFAQEWRDWVILPPLATSRNVFYSRAASA